ncbi:DUF6339 family protein [Clostridium sp. C8-1-8]|uniref:DUF6339 family protein n=1 Tax=Clostridium sp. C8-1-8 TaxID=2698831 RepID=UPI001FAB4069|nr:DUF6339 family protein [Clostridium sp. C8-1-8]
MIEVRLLQDKYKSNTDLYEAFLEDKLVGNDEFLSGEKVRIDLAPTFPVYIANGTENEKVDKFLEAFEVMAKHYIKTDRDVHLSERFWHSLLCQHHREYLLENYPQIKDGGFKEFKNIVFKDFDWENYIYKCILGAQYITDIILDENHQKRYYKLIAENLDLYNYIIKYSIFRNDVFLIKILEIVDKYEISQILKAKIKDREVIERYNLGKDERYGRRVIFEFNKSYPVVMVPMLSDEELEEKFFEHLSLYYDISTIEKWNRNNVASVIA